MKIGNRHFDLNGESTYVMGILNVTPDSFSDGGNYCDKDVALRHVEEMLEEGADIIDIGGESTRPGFQKVAPDEEINRVCSVISAIKERFDVPISVDSYKACVVEEAIKNGADVINDVWGFKLDNCSYKGYEGDEDRTMASVAVKTGVPVILMHSARPTPEGEKKLADEGTKVHVPASEASNVVRDMKVYAEELIGQINEMAEAAVNAGVLKENIIVDPGVGFGRTQEENLAIMKYLKDICEAVSYPVLLGTSRKTFIGNALGLPVEEREEGTMVTTIMAAQAGCPFVRVHDVKKNARALKMYKSIMEV
ncbi:MAG: dihydropteroate synthase [Eubacterium sp.]|nr:dihydropteroate synthase [Eubacterium sp.]